MKRTKPVLTTKQRISNVVEQWYLKEPLLFMVWTTHELCVNPSLTNIRVGLGKVEYNPAFIETLDDKTLYQVLQFEAMRIILKHPYLRRKEIQRLAYIASNITLQEYLKTSLDFPYAKNVFNTKEYDHKYFEFYYQQLLKQIENKGSAMEPCEPGAGQQSGATSHSDQSAGGGNQPPNSKGQQDSQQSPAASGGQSD